jgi:OOP family OmpA-OmpF porin
METRMTQAVRSRLLAGAVCIFGGLGASAAFAVSPSEAYVTDNSGNIVRDGYGECVRTPGWTPEAAVQQCDAEVFAAFERQAQAEPQAPPMQRITLDADTTFDFDKATLTEQGKADLDRIVQAAKQSEDTQVRVTGYTDRIGPEGYNEELSKRRAQAVQDYLVENGVPESAISIAARGEQDPVVSCEGIRGNALIECLRPNRRSEVEFAGFEVRQENGGSPMEE